MLASLRRFVRNLFLSFRYDPFLIGLLCAVVIAIIYFIANYQKCFQDFECVVYFSPAALRNGQNFSLRDIFNAFNAWGFDVDSRPRFLSYFFYIIIIKTRLLLWKLMLPHPSLSPIWLFTLVVSPVVFYKFLKRALNDRNAALAGVLVYISSCGYLFNATMLFHPGKPLVNTVIIIMFYLLAKKHPLPTIINHSDTNCKIDWQHVKTFFPWVIIALFLDETGLFCLGILGIWNYRYFIPYRFSSGNLKICVRNCLIYLIPLLVFFIIITAIVPAITQAEFGQKFDFLAYLRQNLSYEKLHVPYLFRHAATMFSASLLPWRILDLQVPVVIGHFKHPALAVSTCLIVFILTAYLSWRYREYSQIYKRIITLVIAFILFQTLVASFHPLILGITGYHYGPIFSVMFSFLCSVIFLNLSQKIPRGIWIVRAALCYIIIIQLINFDLINSMWISHSDWKGATFVNDPEEIILGLLGQDKNVNTEALRQRIIRNVNFDAEPYYLKDTVIPDSKEKISVVREVWNNWKHGKCNLVLSGEGLMFIQNLWLYGELCPRLVIPDVEDAPLESMPDK